MSATRVILSYPWEDRGGEERYICSFPERVQVVAKKELREDDLARHQALHQFRHWIRKNKDLAHCRTDDNFLLRFLRVKKFSLPMAETMLLKYLNLRQTFPHLAMSLDPLHPAIMQLIDNGYMFPSPVRDANGRKVVFYVAGNFDPYKFTCSDMARCHMVTYEALMDDEENQVLGFTHVGDIRSVSMAHVSLWSPTEFATIFKWGEQSVPMRHKEVHFMNVPSAVKYVYDFARSRLSQKIRDRFSIHNSLAELHSKVDPKVLPKEYGGEIPMKDMIEEWKKVLISKRDHLLALDKIELLDNKSILKNDKNNNFKKGEIYSLAGSFRKLEVD